MYDFLGVTENFAAIAKMPWTMRLRWLGANDAPLSLDGVSFKGRIALSNGGEAAMTCEKSEGYAEGNVLIVASDPLPEGRHYYELYCVSDSGAENRVLSGHIGVIPGIEELRNQLAGMYEARTLNVRLSGDVSARLQLEWLASSAAMVAAEQAWQHLQEMRATWNDMEDTRKRALEALDSLDKLDKEIEATKQKVDKTLEETVPWIGDNGNWWRGQGEGAYDMGKRAVGRDGVDGLNGTDGSDGRDGSDGVDGKDGEPGKSPVMKYVNDTIDGVAYEGIYWFNWDDDAGEYVFSRVKAEAKDGMPGVDADAFRTVYIESADELPEAGDKSTIYYVPQRNAQGEVELYHMWKWLEHADDGHYEWHNMFDTPTVDYFAQKGLENVPILAGNYEVAYPASYLPRISWVRAAVSAIVSNAIAEIKKIATAGEAGLLKLGSQNKYEDGAWLATNADGQGVIPPATTTRYGAVKVSTSTPMTNENAGLVGLNENGQLMTFRAGYQRFGGVALGTQYEVVCNNAPHCIPIPVANGDTTYNQYAGNMAGAITLNLAQEGCLKYNAAGPNGSNNTNAIWLDYDENSLSITDGKLSAGVWCSNAVIAGAPKPVTSDAVIKYVDERLKDYIKSSDGLTDYYTKKEVDSLFTSKLASYVTTSSLTSQLGSYVTTTSLTSKLSTYVTSASLTSTLGNYVQGANGLKKIHPLTLAQYNALATKETGTWYPCT